MRVIVYQASDTSALSKNFTRKDFKCPCGCTRQMVDSELVEKLQAIRDKLGKAIKVTSGYRCITHNAAVGGSSGSKHRYGMAADWRLVDRSINPVALGILAQPWSICPRRHPWHESNVALHHAGPVPQHHLPEIHFADHPPGLYRGCKQSGYKDAPGVAGADPGRHFWRKNRKRPAESAGEAQAGRGWHLRPCQLAGNFWGQQVSVT